MATGSLPSWWIICHLACRRWMSHYCPHQCQRRRPCPRQPLHLPLSRQPLLLHLRQAVGRLCLTVILAIVLASVMVASGRIVVLLVVAGAVVWSGALSAGRVITPIYRNRDFIRLQYMVLAVSLLVLRTLAQPRNGIPL